MSGTSADGIDVALVRISGRAPFPFRSNLKDIIMCGSLLRVREAILRLANGGATTTAEISQLNFLMGEEFAAAAVAACKRWRVPSASNWVDRVARADDFSSGTRQRDFLGDAASWRRRCRSGSRALLRRGRASRRLAIFVPRIWQRAGKGRRWCRLWIICFTAIASWGAWR